MNQFPFVKVFEGTAMDEQDQHEKREVFPHALCHEKLKHKKSRRHHPDSNRGSPVY